MKSKILLQRDEKASMHKRFHDVLKTISEGWKALHADTPVWPHIKYASRCKRIHIVRSTVVESHKRTVKILAAFLTVEKHAKILTVLL